MSIVPAVTTPPKFTSPVEVTSISPAAVAPAAFNATIPEAVTSLTAPVSADKLRVVTEPTIVKAPTLEVNPKEIVLAAFKVAVTVNPAAFAV